MDKEKWILPYLRQYRWLFILSITLGSLTILLGTALMFTSGYLISKTATKPENILMVYVPIVGVRTFGIGRAVFSYVEKLTKHQFVLKIISNMRTKLYKMIEPRALFIRSRFQTGDFLGILADDIEHLQDFYLKTLFPALTSLLIYSIIIFTTGLFSIPFAITLAVLIGLLTFIGPAISLVYSKTKNEQLKQGKHLHYTRMTDAILGISDWIFSGNHPTFIREFEKHEQKLFKLEVKKHHFVNLRDVFNQFVLGIIVVIAIAWANKLTVSGEIPATFIAAIGLALLSLLESFLPIADAISETTSYQDSLKRLESLQSEDLPSQKSENDLTEPNLTSEISIDIQQLNFSYLPGQSCIEGLNLSIKPGEKIALLGRSGSGKSTLVNILFGALRPNSGEVRINSINANLLSSSIHKIIGVLNQKPYLFNTTVLNNIRLGNPEASDNEVYEAARMVQLDDMIRQLPFGYETNMQEAGKRFSGGEQQRIALARILLQKTPIVILDEPTVGLDPITESKLVETIFATLKEKTIIWVTHHLIGVEKMDRILFLDKGKITMDGTHHQLLKNNEKYRTLYFLDLPLTLMKKEYN